MIGSSKYITNNNAIIFKKVSKRYYLHHEKPTLSESLFLNRRKEEFWALKNVSFSISRGDSVGLIGPNGSGKTTILEMIAGLTSQTCGNIKTQGRVVSLLELDAGFHPDLSGIENIYLNALLLGMTRKEIKEKYNEIIKFSEVQQFIDAPLYTYSAGMVLRLAFSIAVFSNPEIMVIDENVSVGDEGFKNKSYEKMMELRKNDVTFVLSSHDMFLIKSITNKCLLVNAGKLKDFGNTNEIVKKYLESDFKPQL